MADNILKYEFLNSKFIVGKDEYNFQEVLDDFSRAEYINIVTYNISTNCDFLLNSLKEASKRKIPINIITNIPKRWSMYNIMDEKSLKCVKKNIEKYMNKLDPRKLGELSNVYFNFNNHSKIIMTNNIIYWGSSNFSDKSRENYECGTISKDNKFICYVNKQVIPQLINCSLSYYDKEYNNCILKMQEAILLLNSIKDEIHYASYNVWEDYDTSFSEVEYFDVTNNDLRWEMLEPVIQNIQYIEPLLQNLYDELEESNKIYSRQSFQNLIEKYESYVHNANNKITNLLYKVKDLAEFDENKYANYILQEKFYSEATEEYLDYFAQKAVDISLEKKEKLISDSQKDIEALLKILEVYRADLMKFTAKIIDVSKLNPRIDNTRI